MQKDGSRYVVTGTIAQGTPAFWLQVPLVLQATDGPDARREVSVKASTAPFRIELPFKPTQITLDPRVETLRAGLRNEPAPTLLGLQTFTGPLLVVYATGGTPAENAAVKAVALEQAKEVFALATVTVKADRDTTPQDLSGSNVFLLGRPQSLRIPVAWREMVPFRYTDDGIALGERRWQGDDLWSIAVLPHPTHPKYLVGHAAGAGAEAIRKFRYQADLDSLKALLVVRGAGKPVAAEPAQSADANVVPLTP